MKIRELVKYAQDNGFNTVKFWCREKLIAGRFLDAFFEFVIIPVVDESSFVTLNQLEEIFGYDLEFEIVTDEQKYNEYVLFSFIIRGKEVPSKYLYKEEW